MYRPGDQGDVSFPEVAQAAIVKAGNSRISATGYNGELRSGPVVGIVPDVANGFTLIENPGDPDLGMSKNECGNLPPIRCSSPFDATTDRGCIDFQSRGCGTDAAGSHHSYNDFASFP
jgi:hypothetical protein